MVQVSIARALQLQGVVTDVVKGLVVNDVALIGVLNQLVEGEGCVVGLDNGLGNLGRGSHGERAHNPARED